MTTAIELAGVGKRYWQLEEQAMLLKSLLPFNRPKRHELWSLHDVSLEIGHGEVVGIIGRNGAGKTTLLRLLAGVTQPTVGRLTVRGRLAPLISVGVGFRPDMSGRENVYLNGLLLGLNREEIRRKFDQIVDFAEVEDFIDTPVKFYSSGMFVRLGFAVAVHAEPEILLVDEVLAVGDLAFQLKCQERMRELRGAGTTIVFVSHSMPAVQALCPRVLVLHEGGLVHDGTTEDGIALLHELLSSDASARTAGNGAASVELLEAALIGADGPTNRFARNEPLEFRARLRFAEAVDDPVFGLTVLTEQGSLAYNLHTPPMTKGRRFESGQEIDLQMRMRGVLGRGTYRIHPAVVSSDGLHELWADRAGRIFYVDGPVWATGIADLDGEIVVDGDAVHHAPDYRLTGADPVRGVVGSAEEKPDDR